MQQPTASEQHLESTQQAERAETSKRRGLFPFDEANAAVGGGHAIDDEHPIEGWYAAVASELPLMQ